MKIKVWELSIRIFHWLLAALVFTTMATSFQENLLQVHILSGQGILILLLYRLGWGFIGGHYARFSNFVKGPKAALGQLVGFLRGEHPRFLGHNPLAGWMFLLMMLILGLLVASGLILMGGSERIGILSEYLTPAQAEPWAKPHMFLAYILMGMVFIHISAAILESRFQKENLVASMISGLKEQGEEPTAQPKANKGLQRSFLGLILILTVALYTLWPLDYRTQETKLALAKSESEPRKLYSEECGSCHFEFPANLLPWKSWQKMQAELEEHFDDDASLDEENATIIFQYLREQSLEQSNSEWAFQIGRNILTDEAPQRFTTLPYWKEKHQEIEPSVYEHEKIGSKLNCGACHDKAKYGSFEDAHISIPN